MYGLKSIIERGRAQRLANGGRVRGPGTGISDDIQATVPEGSYIMPADSTEQAGLGFGLPKRPTKANPDDAPKLGLRRNGVPVNLSNGEHALSPEQVHAVGAQVLDAVRDATHVPADMQGFGLKRAPAQSAPGLGFGPTSVLARMKAERQSFADGGLAEDDPNRPRGLAGDSSTAGQTASPGGASQGFGLSRPPQTPAPGLGFPPAAQPVQQSRAPGTETGFGFPPRSQQLPQSTPAASGAGMQERSSFPGPFEVGNSGQRSLVGTKIVDPIKGFFADSAAAARGEGEYGALRAARQAPESAAGAAATVQPSESSPSISVLSPSQVAELERNNARIMDPNYDVRSGQVRASPATPFDQNSLTQQQRNTAGDVYRDAWQREAPGGLQRAGTDATTLYNAEQQVRGTGITARRGANGVMEFSGDGANALPQNYTQGVDLNAANASMARANAIRQSYLDSQAGSDGGPRGGVISDNSADETNARFARSRLLEQIGRAGRSQAAALAQIANADATNARSSADLASRDRNNDADRTLRQQQFAQQSGMDRDRLGIEQQRVGAEVEGKRLQNQRLQTQNALLDQVLAETDPTRSGQLAQQLRLALGQQEQRPQNAQVIYNEELINPAQPMAGTRRVPMILNRDGTASVVTPRAEPKALPNGVSRDAAIQSARRALESGYNREAVLARLGEYGLTIEDIAR